MLLEKLVDNNKPFVIFKKPQSGKVYIWQQNNSGLYTSGDLSMNGYYFAPFDFNEHPVIVFPEKHSNIKEVMLHKLEPFGAKEYRFEFEITGRDAEVYKKKVNQALSLINLKKLHKIVLSRFIKVEVEDFDIFDGLIKLMHTYDNAYVYLWHHPAAGTWMGATPELLAGYKNGWLTTVSLAGTVTGFESENTLDLVNGNLNKFSINKEDVPGSWGAKEFNEQQIVTDYIEDILKKYATHIETGKPETIRQGHLEHIKTGFSAEIKPVDLNTVIRQLHPTPAVCGLPVEAAKYYIKQLEAYDRRFYTGFIGVKNHKTASLYVNLRCMEVREKFFLIYAGGGIVAGSRPEKEWQEILLKAEVILSGLNNKKYTL